MNRPLSTKELHDMLEQGMINAKPDDTIDPKYFAVRMTDSGAGVTLPLGMDLRFCRGVDVEIGYSNAANEYTVTVIPNEKSRYNLGLVDRMDGLLHIPVRSVQIIRDKLLKSRDDLVLPNFSRRSPTRVFLPRNGNLVMHFNIG